MLMREVSFYSVMAVASRMVFDEPNADADRTYGKRLIVGVRGANRVVSPLGLNGPTPSLLIRASR